MKLLKYIFILFPFCLSVAYAEGTVSLWAPCMGYYDENNQRMIDIGSKMGVSGRGMKRQEYDDKYCVSYVKCIALGYCTTQDAGQQKKANELKKKLEAEKRQREREAQLSKQKAEAAEKVRIEKERVEKAKIAAEAKKAESKYKLNNRDALEFAQSKVAAEKVLPPKPQKCIIETKQSTGQMNFSLYRTIQASKDAYSKVNKGDLCNGNGGSLGTLDCPNPVNLFGMQIANCTATVTCPPTKKEVPCSSATRQ
ncbi:hypothetical protein QR674_07990 [Acinetobacter chinensis]|uniref:Uncharacterized protein n=1 Tax=Acinetobacter chinensis TaxID=2004650 RepID=A0ABU3WFT9_9GAMM|nr:hypothetical protein [Acinetobacter chinensis]MDV2468923.1 hypothetical protein [Acinetobacter chinensis]